MTIKGVNLLNRLNSEKAGMNRRSHLALRMQQVWMISITCLRRLSHLATMVKLYKAPSTTNTRSSQIRSKWSVGHPTCNTRKSIKSIGKARCRSARAARRFQPPRKHNPRFHWLQQVVSVLISRSGNSSSSRWQKKLSLTQQGTTITGETAAFFCLSPLNQIN